MDIALNITRKCNKNCTFCYLKLKEEELPFKKIKEIVDGRNINTVTLTGGEPLMHPEIFKIIDYINGKCNHIHLLTNGILLSGDVIEKLIKYNVELFISYNKPDKTASKKIKSAFSNGLKINIHFFLTEENLSNLENILQDLNYIESILFLYPTNVTKNNIQMYEPSKWFKLLLIAMETAKKYKIKYFFEQAFILKDNIKNKESACPTGKDIFIDTNGQNYPCCLLTDLIKGENQIYPIKYKAKCCQFLKNNRLPQNDEYIRICPIIITDKFDRDFKFPSHLNKNE